MARYTVVPVNTQWGIWDNELQGWASFFSYTPEDLTYSQKADAERQAHWMSTGVGLN
jgi:hypothetical protein